MNKFIKYFVIDLFIAIIMLLIVFIFFRKKKNKNVQIGTSFDNKKVKKIKRYNLFYEKLTRIPIIGMKISLIRKRLYIKNNKDEFTLRANAVSIFLASILVSAAIYIILLLVYGHEIYNLVIFAIGAVLSNVIITDSFIGNDTKLLKGLIEFIQDLKHQYHINNGNIDESIYNATQSSNDSMAQHGKKIHEMINSGEEELEKYYKMCPNKYLKILTGICFLTKEYADEKIDGVSIFIKDLNYIMEELKMEILKRNQISYWIKGFTIISLFPVLMPDIIEKWLIKYLPISEAYFNSSRGVMSKIAVIIISFFSFSILKRIEKDEDNYSEIKVKEVYFEKEVLQRSRILKELVRICKPKIGSKQDRELRQLLADSGTYLQIEWLCLRQITIVVVTFILLIFLFIVGHKVDNSSILNTYNYGVKDKEFLSMIGKSSEEDKLKVESSIELDKKIYNCLKKFKKIDKSDIEKELNKFAIIDKDKKDIIINEIGNKINAIKLNHIKWYEICIAFIISLMTVDLPILLLRFEKYMRKSNMDDEIYQFHTIILLLMNNQRASIQMILLWMERFSNVYYNPINKCNNNLQNGIKNSLISLKEEVKYKPFSRIIDNLIICEQISVKDAFDSLQVERDSYKDERKEMNKRVVDNKVNLGEMLGLLPTGVVLFLYAIFPLIWSVSKQMNELFDSLSKIN